MIRIKKFALCFLAAFILFCGTVAVSSATLKPYVGNKSTKVYHISECTFAGKISSGNRIYFSSRSEAESRGYRRCYYCGDDVVEPGHGGGSGNSVDGGNSDSSISESISNQTPVEKPQEENLTIWQEIWGVLRVILIAVYIVAFPFIVSISFSVIYQIAKWIRNRKLDKHKE